MSDPGQDGREAAGAAGAGPRYAARTKYEAPGRAARYARRSERRNREEAALVDRVLAGRRAPRTVLDAPCGTGRLSKVWLARGAAVRAADLSPAMREAASEALRGIPGLLGVDPLDLEAPVEAGAPRHDLVLCFRLLHHLPDAATRRRVLASLAARSCGDVLVSFHHPVSVHHAARALRRLVTGRRGDRHAVLLRRLVADAESVGLRFVRARALSPGLRDLWVALFETGADRGAPRSPADEGSRA